MPDMIRHPYFGVVASLRPDPSTLSSSQISIAGSIPSLALTAAHSKGASSSMLASILSVVSPALRIYLGIDSQSSGDIKGIRGAQRNPSEQTRALGSSQDKCSTSASGESSSGGKPEKFSFLSQLRAPIRESEADPIPLDDQWREESADGGDTTHLSGAYSPNPQSSQKRAAASFWLKCLSQLNINPVDSSIECLADQAPSAATRKTSLSSKVERFQAIGVKSDRDLALLARDNRAACNDEFIDFTRSNHLYSENSQRPAWNPLSFGAQTLHQLACDHHQLGDPKIANQSLLAEAMAKSVFRTQLFVRPVCTSTQDHVNAGLNLKADGEFIHLFQKDSAVNHWKSDEICTLNPAIQHKQTHDAVCLSENSLLRRGRPHPQHQLLQPQIDPPLLVVVSPAKSVGINAHLDQLIAQDALQQEWISTVAKPAPVWAIDDWSRGIPPPFTINGGDRGLTPVPVPYLEQGSEMQVRPIITRVETDDSTFNEPSESARCRMVIRMLARLIAHRINRDIFGLSNTVCRQRICNTEAIQDEKNSGPYCEDVTWRIEMTDQPNPFSRDNHWWARSSVDARRLPLNFRIAPKAQHAFEPCIKPVMTHTNGVKSHPPKTRRTLPSREGDKALSLPLLSVPLKQDGPNSGTGWLIKCRETFYWNQRSEGSILRLTLPVARR